MSKIIYSIPNLELFDVEINFKQSYSFGCNQAWYKTMWQKESGCGPTTATNMFYYISQRDKEKWGNLCQYENPKTQDSLLKLMEDIWEYVTPTKAGVHSTALFIDGAKKYALSKGIELNCKYIDVPNVLLKNRIAHDDFISFIKENLEIGYPLAFLNLSNGELKNLHSWHWVNIMSLEIDENGDYFCLACDEGEKKKFNMSVWFKTTMFGGGIVAFNLD